MREIPSGGYLSEVVHLVQTVLARRDVEHVDQRFPKVEDVGNLEME